jgi:two-component system clock-associated histidine kinase SasA
MEVTVHPFLSPDAPLQLLLFVDKRPSSGERIRQIRNRIKELAADDDRYELQVIDVSEQPHLAEHFKLVATPSLIKIHPEPRQVLAGSNLLAEVETWWSRWQRSVEDYLNYQKKAVENHAPDRDGAKIRSIAYSAELLKLSDEVFNLKREKEKLEAQLQFKDRLIAMLAHDLRNPLTAVSIALETLEMGSSVKEGGKTRLSPELTAQLIRHARTQAKTIDRMITDVLHAAKEESAEFRIQPEQVNLGNLCRDVLELLNEQFVAKSHQVLVDIPADLPEVYADPERVRQVLVNLLDNASKYTPEKGTIRVGILHRTTQKVQVSICDDGPGIPIENQERIFENRFRLQRDQEKEGYGIGLALCKRVIQAHYGQIWVDSDPNQGSCFHFTLPVYHFMPVLA